METADIIKTTQPLVQKKLSIISFSGDFDKLVAAFTLATGAAAVGYEVNIFFTFWAWMLLRRNRDAPLLVRVSCQNFLASSWEAFGVLRLAA